MSTRTARNDPYQLVTDQIIQHLQRGVVPWRRPWRKATGRPRNFHTGRAYQGVNVLLLGWQAFDSPWWMTFRQVNERGGLVRKGEHGVPIMKWGRYDRTANPGDGTDEKQTRYYLKSYSVFNERQIDGLEFPPADPSPGLSVEQRLARGEAIVAGMSQPPTLRESKRNRAAYHWKKDSLEMPPFARFDSPEDYYLTLFHELAHATGHPTRLDRKGVTESDGFGGKVYSQEELVAEMAAAFLGMEADLVRDQHEQSAAYLKGWLDVLQESDHRRWLVHAANQGARAADFILGRKPEETEADAKTEAVEPTLA